MGPSLSLDRWALRVFPLERLVGVDVDPVMIEICRSAIPGGTFHRVGAPPYGMLKDGEFDLAIIYSVLSHLSEPAAVGMLNELRRVVKPGGYVAFTTLRLAHISVWGRQTSHPLYGPALSRVEFDEAAWRAKAERGEHLFVPVGSGDSSRPGSWYGQAIVTRAFLERALPQGLSLVAFGEPNDLPQALAILRHD